MSLWWLIAAIAGAGALGGVANALLSDNGFLLPKTENGIFRPGYVGNIFISALSAIISWGLSSPLSQEVILGGAPKAYNLTLAALVGALLVGVAGARWLTNEVDKQFLKAAASTAAAKRANDNAPQAIMNSSPAHALQIAQSME